jgi:hypothetical protein
MRMQIMLGNNFYRKRFKILNLGTQKPKMTRAIVLESRSDKIVIDKCIVQGLLGRQKASALYDTGAQETLLDTKFASMIGARLTGRSRGILGVDGDPKDPLICPEAEIYLEVYDGNGVAMGTFNVSLYEYTKATTGGHELLLGMDFTAERGKGVKVIIE